MKKSIIWLLITCAFTSQAQVTKESIGWAFANLTGISYWTAQNPFCDAFKTAKRWDKSPSGQGGLDQTFLDANGWVTSFPAGITGAECLLFTGAGGRYPTGDYVLTWTGGAANGSDITVTGSGITLQSESLTTNPKRRVYSVSSTNNNGLRVAITSTTIRNIHFWFPGLEGGDPNGFKNGNAAEGRSPFTPWFKETLSIFKALRYMDWNQTNNSRQQTWSQRKPEGFAFFSSMESDQHAAYTTFGSVPYEYMIYLCNELNIDLWVNIPHLADNNYITQLATLIRNNLKSNLRVWVEYSNEHWNSGFATFGWLNANKGSLPNIHQFYAVKATNCWTLFENAFGGGARVVRLIAGAWSDFMTEYYKVTGFAPEVAAITGYLGGNDKKFTNGESPYQYIKSNIGSITTTQIIDKCMAEVLPQLRTSWTNAVALAASKGIPMVTYEAGSHIASTEGGATPQAVADFIVALHRDAGFYNLQLQALRDWKDAGGKGYNMFTDVGGWNGRFGCWGHKEYYNQPVSQAHRYRAFVTFVNENPGTGNPQPNTLQAENYTTQSGGANSTAQTGYTGTGYYDMGGNGTWSEYVFNITTAGSYTLAIRYANGGTTNRACNVITNGVTAANNFVPTGSWTTWIESSSTINLVAGSNRIRIQATTANGGPNLDRLVITPVSAARMVAIEKTNVFPNPASHTIRIAGLTAPAQVDITTLSGQLVKRVVTRDGTIDISTLPKGVYVVKTAKRVFKLIKE